MMPIAGANMEQPAFNYTIKKTFTRIHGRPLRRDQATLHKEIEHVFIYISVTCFDWSGQYGLLAEAKAKAVVDSGTTSNVGKYSKQPLPL